MMIIFGIFIIIAFIACYWWYKLCVSMYRFAYKIINRKSIKENSNPYILAQKKVDLNNKHYEEYLEWMSKNSEGVPIDKVMTKEEFNAEQKIKSLIK